VSSFNEEHKFASRYAAWVMRNRLLVVLVVLITTILAATQIKNLDIRNDPDTLLPATNRYVATNAYGEQKFGMGNLMVLGFILKEPGDIYQPWFVNLVRDVHEKMVNLSNSRGKNFMDLAAQKIKYMGADNGSLVFKRLIPTAGISEDPEKAKEELAFLKEGLETNPVMAPMLLYMEDADGNRCEFGVPDCTARGTFIIGDYDDGVKLVYLPWIRDVIAIADEVKAKYGDRLEIRIAGEPYFLAYMLYDLVNKWWLFVISIVIVVGILWWQNKGWRGAAYPMIGVFATIALTLGVMGFSAFKLTTMMVLTPMLLLAIGTGHAVQVTRRFLTEMLNNDCDAKISAEKAIAFTIIPATLAIITDMAGFATLATVDISFYKAYAYFGMFGMATLLITTTTLIPILMSYNPPKIDVEHDHKICEPTELEDMAAKTTTSLIMGPGKWVIVLMVALLIGWSANETKIMDGTAADLMPGVEKGINYSRAAFKESSATIQDLNRLGEVMPGVISVNIPFTSREPMAPVCNDEDADGNLLPKGCWDEETKGAQGIMNDAEVMGAIEKMENWMRAHPNIGFTGSYVQYIRLVNMLLSSKTGDNMELFGVPTNELIAKHPEAYADPEDPDYVPDANFIVQNFNGLLEVNTSDGDLDAFVDSSTWNDAVIMGFVNTMDPVLAHKVVEDIDNYLVEHENDPGFNKIKFGLSVGETVTMPETGEVVTIEGDPSITLPGLGGFLGATEATREVSYDNWLLSPLQTAIAIFIISAVMFRSISVAVVLIVMLAITLFAQYGMGAYFTSVQNWSGNLAFHLLVTLSIAMGLGVDYSIYLISRLREEYQATMGNWSETVFQTLRTTGGAVLASVIVLLGSFIPLVSTDLANTWGLGVYIGEALVIDVITAFTFLPIMIWWLKPNYIFKSNQ
jgi:uncharacterized protein